MVFLFNFVSPFLQHLLAKITPALAQRIEHRTTLFGTHTLLHSNVYIISYVLLLFRLLTWLDSWICFPHLFLELSNFLPFTYILSYLIYSPETSFNNRLFHMSKSPNHLCIFFFNFHDAFKGLTLMSYFPNNNRVLHSFPNIFNIKDTCTVCFINC